MSTVVDTPSEATMVAAWERTRRLDPHARALDLVVSARPDLDIDDARALPLGRRDAILIDYRCAWRGSSAPAYVACPACNEGLEHDVDLNSLKIDPPAPKAAFPLKVGEFSLLFRPPTTADLEAVRRAPPDAGREVLLERIVESAQRRGDTVRADKLPPEVVAAIEAEIDRVDPVATIIFNQRCPVCFHEFASPFDIAGYLWHELDVAARRLLREVDVLARAYGWSEPEVLALSSARRGVYLEMVAAG